jgi:hypothetical protein
MELKQRIITSLILDWSNVSHVHVDASSIKLELLRDDTLDHFIYFISLKLSWVKCNYTMIK